MTFSKNVFSIFLCILSFTLLGQDSIDLRLKLLPKDSFSYEFISEPTITDLEINDAFSTGIRSVFEEDFYVKSVNDAGVAEVEVTYARQIKKIGYGEAMEMFDTQAPDTTNNYFNKVGYLYMEQIGRKSTLMMLPTQEIYPSDTSQIKKRVAFHSNSKTGIGVFTHLLNFHPSHPVKVGDSWSKTFFEPYIDQKVDYTFTLKEEKETTYIIEIKGKLSSEGLRRSTPVEMIMQTMQFTQEITGTETGYIEVDKETGWVKELFINQVKSGFFTIYNPDEENDDGEINPISSKKNIYIRRLVR